MLTPLTITRVTEIDTLFCEYNRLQYINVSGLTKLRLFACYNNRISTLDLSGLSLLDGLQCSDNLLTTINLTGLTSLTRLYCKNNYLPNTKALVGYNPALTTTLEFEPQNTGKPSAPLNLQIIPGSGKITLTCEPPHNVNRLRDLAKRLLGQCMSACTNQHELHFYRPAK